MADEKSVEKRDQNFVISTNEIDLNTEKEEIDSKRIKYENLNDFEFVKILSEDSKSKSLMLHLQHKTDHKDAVCILEKSQFAIEKVENIFSSEVIMQLQLNNDVYSRYLCILPKEMNFVKNTLIYPANEEHLNKYSEHQTYWVTETSEIFKQITLPFIEEQAGHLQWVYNILEKKAERDRIVYENPHPRDGFILLPDLKWEQTQIQNLYVMAVCNSRDIKSLRDLNASHLPLLKNILIQGKEAIQKKYNVDGCQLRVFVHYQPTYYHFHVHFTHVKYDAPGIIVGRAHLLQDIIDNIENFDNHYYAKKTLHYIISDKSLLYTRFKTA